MSENTSFDYPKVSQNNNWKVQLFPHQLSAIWMMEDRELNNIRKITTPRLGDETELNSNIGIYSDPTGYGKTLSVVGLLSRNKLPWDINNKYKQVNIRNICEYDSDVNLTVTNYTYLNKVDCSLLVVNQSIITQWINELNLLNVNHYVVNTRKKIDSLDIHNHTLIIVIPTMYNKLIDKHRNIVWKRFIYDEPVNTHLPAMRNVKAGFFWFITATPNQLTHQSRGSGSHFLRSIFNYWLGNDILSALIVKNDIDYVKSSYQFPPTEYLYHVCYQPVYNMCRDYIDRETSDMISAGNISGAIHRLGGNQTSNIFELIESKLKIKLEQRVFQLRSSIIGNNSVNTIRHHNERRLTLIRQLNDIKDQYTQRLNDNCSICLDTLDKPVLVPCCQNILCGCCILEWVRIHHSCPLCRSSIQNSSLVYIKGKNETPTIVSKDKDRPLTKPETILRIINNNKNGKFIVFSNYSESFQHILSAFHNNDIKYKELKGQISRRERIIKEFKKGVIQVLFLNSKNNGAGINLQEASDIILYHELNDDLKTQVIGRANRIGRKKSLFVHQLL